MLCGDTNRTAGDSMRTVAVFVAALASVLATAGCGPSHINPPQAPTGAATHPPELVTLRVADPSTAAGPYRRVAQFGAAWSLDSDRDGCRQRDDVLRRDLRDVVSAGRCAVTAGTLTDPYTGRTIKYDRAHATAVQVDHVYPLGLAWRHGAAEWPQRRRVEFANDLANLVATTAAANQSKGDKGPGQWMPPARSGWCGYATRYVGVAVRYRLSVTATDRRRLAEALVLCSNSPEG
jgi:5-methylcytosine-specific restriction endonuclease McrA